MIRDAFPVRGGSLEIERITFPWKFDASVLTARHVAPVSEIDASTRLPREKTCGVLLNKGSSSATATWKLRPWRGCGDPSRAIAITPWINSFPPLCLSPPFLRLSHSETTIEMRILRRILISNTCWSLPFHVISPPLISNSSPGRRNDN